MELVAVTSPLTATIEQRSADLHCTGRRDGQCTGGCAEVPDVLGPLRTDKVSEFSSCGIEVIDQVRVLNHMRGHRQGRQMTFR